MPFIYALCASAPFLYLLWPIPFMNFLSSLSNLFFPSICPGCNTQHINEEEMKKLNKDGEEKAKIKGEKEAKKPIKKVLSRAQIIDSDTD